MYGVISAIEGFDAFEDLMKNSDIGPWYRRMSRLVKSHAGRRLEHKDIIDAQQTVLWMYFNVLVFLNNYIKFRFWHQLDFDVWIHTTYLRGAFKLSDFDALIVSERAKRQHNCIPLACQHSLDNCIQRTYNLGCIRFFHKVENHCVNEWPFSVLLENSSLHRFKPSYKCCLVNICLYVFMIKLCH